MEKNQSQLRKLQLTQLEMLKLIDSICTEHQISYSLYAGTLLGAVRHQGFIPWDDDLDVCMPRADYDSFIKIWSKIKPQGYLLQNKENTPSFTQSFTKIRKEHTTFLQSNEERGKYHTGIFVDIFPIDHMPIHYLEIWKFKWDCMRYQLYTREFVPPKGRVLTKLAAAILLAGVRDAKRPIVREKLLKKITRYNRFSDYPLVGIETMVSLNIRMPGGMQNKYVRIQFEDAEFSCFAEWDELLKCKYGDYMQLPPEEERIWSHHPIILDFERDYGELIKNER